MKAIIISDLHSDDNFTEERIRVAKSQHPDVVFLLGDIKSTDLYKIEQSFWNDNTKIPMYGITGDDDTANIFDRFEHIENIDGKVIEVCGFKVGGFAGSFKYKNGLFSMRTEEEAKVILDAMPACDIFLSHETGTGYMREMLLKKERADAARIALVEEKKKEIDAKSKFQTIFGKILKQKDDTVIEHIEAEVVTQAREDKIFNGFQAIDDYIRRVQPKLHLFGHYHLNSIAIAEHAEIVQKKKLVHNKEITIKTVEVKEHKELTAFDIGNTTCACNYLFGILEIGDRFAFSPIVPQEVLDYEAQVKESIEEKLFEDSYYVDLSPKEKKQYDEAHRG